MLRTKPDTVAAGPRFLNPASHLTPVQSVRVIARTHGNDRITGEPRMIRAIVRVDGEYYQVHHERTIDALMRGVTPEDLDLDLYVEEDE